MVHPSHAWSSSSDGSVKPKKKLMVKIKAASAVAAPAAAAPVLLVPAPSGKGAKAAAGKAAAPVVVVSGFGPAASKSAVVFSAPVVTPKASAGKAKSSSSSSQSPIAVVALGKQSKKTKKKTKKHELTHLDEILHQMQKRERVLEKYNKLRMQGKRREAIAYVRKHGMLDEIMDTSNIVFVDDKDLLAASSKTHKKGKSSSSKKASTHAKAASPSPELEIVELTPSPKASSIKASTHAKAASPSPELEIVELTPSPRNKSPLSFGQQADILEKKNSTSKPRTTELTLDWRQHLAKLHKKMVESKGRAVSPTFKAHDPAHGDWM
jgi:hypothetical protein